jgi:hypothetical protein
MNQAGQTGEGKEETMKGNIINVLSEAEKFKSLLMHGMQKINEACIIYVTTIDSCPELKKEFHNCCREVPVEAWSAFELVGRNAMDYRLLWGGGKAQSKLRRLPKSEQTRILDAGVELADEFGDKRIVPVDLLDSEDIKQVFYGCRVRNVNEQVIWMKKNGRKLADIQPDDADYYISSGKLVVLKPMKIPLGTLRRMINQ